MHRHVTLFLSICFFFFLPVLVSFSASNAFDLFCSSIDSTRNPKDWPTRLASSKARTLVIYVFGGGDAEYERNLLYFIRETILKARDFTARDGDVCDYVIVLQQDPAWKDPELPIELETNPSVTIVRQKNSCFDLGTVGWILGSHNTTVDISKYTYFVWLNSSVRGPFMPGYLRGRLHWTRPLTDLITEDTKLVGATINCGGAHGLPPYPHVQSYVTATDRDGLSILLQASSVFACWEDMKDVVINSEIGASRAIIDAGYNIDCLMTRYEGVDWREEVKKMAVSSDPLKACNAGFNPLQPGFNDGIDVHPFETMFTKVKASHLEARWPHAVAAHTLSSWIDNGRGPAPNDAIQNNAWFSEHGVEAALADAERRGRDCFDVSFYLNANSYDLGFMKNNLQDRDEQAWSQFIEMGIFEGRPHKWLC